MSNFNTKHKWKPYNKNYLSDDHYNFHKVYIVKDEEKKGEDQTINLEIKQTIPIFEKEETKNEQIKKQNEQKPKKPKNKPKNPIPNIIPNEQNNEFPQNIDINNNTENVNKVQKPKNNKPKKKTLDQNQQENENNNKEKTENNNLQNPHKPKQNKTKVQNAKIENQDKNESNQQHNENNNQKAQQKKKSKQIENNTDNKNTQNDDNVISNENNNVEKIKKKRKPRKKKIAENNENPIQKIDENHENKLSKPQNEQKHKKERQFYDNFQDDTDYNKKKNYNKHHNYPKNHNYHQNYNNNHKYGYNDNEKKSYNHNSYKNKEYSSSGNNHSNYYGKKNYQEYDRYSHDGDKKKNYGGKINNKKNYYSKNYNKNDELYDLYDKNDKRNYKKGKNYKKNKYDINYSEHIKIETVEQGIKNKTLFEGIFLANERMRFFANIKSDLPEKILINDLKSQNRAIHGSTVVFKIKGKKGEKDKNEKKEENQKKEKKIEKAQVEETKKEGEILDDSSDYVTIDEFSVEESESSKSDVLSKLEEELLLDPENDTDLGIKLPIQIKKAELIAEVVFIKNNILDNKQIVGIIENPIPKYKRRKQPDLKKKYMFKPIDKKYPHMLITEINEKIYEKINKEEIKLEESYFLAKYISWDQKKSNPEVHITEYLGPTGEIEIECQSLLKEHDVYTEDFKQECLDSLSSYSEKWEIPLEEKQKRLDLTSEIICTIDPETARDLDDALSIKKIDEDIWEIGVHIADVSHFVTYGDEVDREARLRTTSIYLPHRVIPMLPRVLCEALCSLNPDVERLAFSIFFRLNEQGAMIEGFEPVICKSVIKSCGKLSYEIAQLIIDNKINERKDFPENCIVSSDENIIKNLIEGIRVMNRLAQNRRKERLDTGSLVFDKLKKRFKLDENNKILGYSLEERKEANFLVEEYMLYANIIAGVTLVKNCQEIAVLRKHECPNPDKLAAFKILCSTLGFDVNIKSSRLLNDSLKIIKEAPNARSEYKQIINQKLVTTMQLAKYFVVSNTNESEWHHYALNFDIYTHFTSPIRRYPDILVHRLLFNVIKYGKDSINHTNKNSMMEIMEKCNQCKQASRKVSDGCEKIFTCIYLKNNELYTKAVIISVTNNSVSMIISELNIERRVHFKDFKNIKKVEFIPNKNCVHLSYPIFEKEKQTLEKITIQTFSEVEVRVSATNKFPIDFAVFFVYKENGEKKYIK